LFTTTFLASQLEIKDFQPSPVVCSYFHLEISMKSASCEMDNTGLFSSLGHQPAQDAFDQFWFTAEAMEETAKAVLGQW